MKVNFGNINDDDSNNDDERMRFEWRIVSSDVQSYSTEGRGFLCSPPSLER